MQNYTMREMPFLEIGKENSMKYIDAEKLLVKIKGLQCEQGFEDGETERGYQLAIKNILDIIDSLQQEQTEVDLEKEFNNFLDNIEGVPQMWHSDEQIVWAKSIAKHFFEFGIRTRKEEVK